MEWQRQEKAAQTNYLDFDRGNLAGSGGCGWADCVQRRDQDDASKLAKVERGDLAKRSWLRARLSPSPRWRSRASQRYREEALRGLWRQGKAGAGTAELDKEELQARVDQARAQLEGSSASLNGTRADLERAKVDAEGPTCRC